MADFALTFADGGDAYEFPAVGALPMAVDAVTSTARMTGLSGGFDRYGSEPAPDAIKSQRVSFTLVAATRADMQAKIDAVNALYALGVRKLYLQPHGSLSERWAYARVDNIRFNRNIGEHTDLMQKVQIVFQINPPFWYHDEENNSGEAVSGTSTDLSTISNAGNAIALPRIVVSCTTGQTAENVTIQRLVSAVVVDEIVYAGVLVASDSLTLDAQSKSATLNSASVYADISRDHPDWFRLLPGSNSLKVLMDNAGDAATVTVYWHDTFRG